MICSTFFIPEYEKINWLAGYDNEFTYVYVNKSGTETRIEM